ncbi:PhzF family phenazine biosynthesis protein [Microbacterium sp.]|uniref:PhzF family phenazine biosynthesis protein n=1 Tax=Microbacterium sp. TaxID=51671 RepID=UPI003C72AC05
MSSLPPTRGGASIRVPFAWVDVFADRPLAGNPLPVVFDADALDDDTLRGIAREFNQSETTFVPAPTDSRAQWRLRSFTAVGAEVVGAGHNAIGAWIWLATSSRLDPSRSTYLQQLGDELLEVEILARGDDTATATLDQSSPEFLDGTAPTTELAAALGLTSDAVRSAEVVSTGAAHLLVAVVAPDVVDRARPDAEALRPLLAAAGAEEGIYLYAVTPSTDRHAYARFFNPTVGIVEDPATGTAAGPLAALLVHSGFASAGETVRIDQGTALGRPSILQVRVEGTRVRITGGGLVVATGILRV